MPAIIDKIRALFKSAGICNRSFQSSPEIERKFLIKSIPENLADYPSIEIRQGYINQSLNKPKKRIRQEGDKYLEEMKTGEGRVRMEHSREITEGRFLKLWTRTTEQRIYKTRYFIPYLGFTIEVDEYHNRLDGFFTAEVEFETESECNDFVPPDWFGKEVTNDKRYSNSSLSVNGIPL